MIPIRRISTTLYTRKLTFKSTIDFDSISFKCPASHKRQRIGKTSFPFIEYSDILWSGRTGATGESARAGRCIDINTMRRLSPFLGHCCVWCNISLHEHTHHSNTVKCPVPTRPGGRPWLVPENRTCLQAMDESEFQEQICSSNHLDAMVSTGAEDHAVPYS